MGGAPRPAHAAGEGEVHCRRIEGGLSTLEKIDARERLRFLRGELAHGAHRARVWAWTWAGIYSALTVGSAVLTITSDNEKDRIANGIGTGASFVGLAVLMIMPLDVMRDQRRLERHLRQVPADEDPCATLAYTERLLLRDAKSEAFGAGPLVHAGNFAFNIGLALLLGIGFDNWNAAAQVGLIGIAVGEIQAATQPTDVIRTLRDYRAGRLVRHGPAPLAWAVTPDATRDRVGLRFALSW